MKSAKHIFNDVEPRQTFVVGAKVERKRCANPGDLKRFKVRFGSNTDNVWAYTKGESVQS